MKLSPAGHQPRISWSLEFTIIIIIIIIIIIVIIMMMFLVIAIIIIIAIFIFAINEIYNYCYSCHNTDMTY